MKKNKSPILEPYHLFYFILFIFFIIFIFNQSYICDLRLIEGTANNDETNNDETCYNFNGNLLGTRTYDVSVLNIGKLTIYTYENNQWTGVDESDEHSDPKVLEINRNQLKILECLRNNEQITEISTSYCDSSQGLPPYSDATPNCGRKNNMYELYIRIKFKGKGRIFSSFHPPSYTFFNDEQQLDFTFKNYWQGTDGWNSTAAISGPQNPFENPIKLQNIIISQHLD